MIWLTWRQLRAQTIAAGVLLAALAGLLLATGFSLAGQASSSGLSSCYGQAACSGAASVFLGLVGSGPLQVVLDIGVVLTYVTPALIGIFWGAPLISREIETGAFRLAWSQSVSRTRWVLVKLGLTGLAAMAVGGLLSWMTNWWASPIYRAGTLSGGGLLPSRINPVSFGAQGIAPLGYAAFAFALGVTAGLLLKRTIPAMAVTLGLFALVQITWPKWVRPHLVSPVRDVRPLSVARLNFMETNRTGSMMRVHDTAGKPGAWIISNSSIRPDGQEFTGPAPSACMGSQSFRACDASIARLHLRQVVSYQPGSRFWELQWIETGIFLALAVALAAFCAWWVRRRQLT